MSSTPIKISTAKYNKKGKVDIDGHIWDVVLPGAGTELRFSQASRACKLYAARIDLLDKKIDSGKATLDELDQYEDYAKKFEENERVIYETFTATFKDGTPDNSEVKAWVEATPTMIIMMAMEDVKEQANEPKEETDEPAKPETKES